MSRMLASHDVCYLRVRVKKTKVWNIEENENQYMKDVDRKSINVVRSLLQFVCSQLKVLKYCQDAPDESDTN